MQIARTCAGCRVQGAGSRVQGAGCRVQGAECRVQGPPWCRSLAPSPSPAWSTKGRLQVTGYRVQGTVGAHQAHHPATCRLVQTLTLTLTLTHQAHHPATCRLVHKRRSESADVVQRAPGSGLGLQGSGIGLGIGLQGKGVGVGGASGFEPGSRIGVGLGLGL